MSKRQSHGIYQQLALAVNENVCVGCDRYSALHGVQMERAVLRCVKTGRYESLSRGVPPTQSL